jgi:rhamnulokinase
MSEPNHYLAIDLGAESGRAILGTLDGGRMTLEEVHRFANGPVRLPDGLHWDVLRLWSEIKTGLSLAAHRCPSGMASIALDTWGVDFALLDRQGALLGNPFHYRDRRTEGTADELIRRAPREEIFAATGIQFMPINSLNQLLAMVLSGSPQLAAAHTFLTIPDLFNDWLCGSRVCELTNATTTQCYDPHKQAWAYGILGKLGIPSDIFPQVVPPGTHLGSLLPDLADELGMRPIPVIAPACHDTGSAVAAIPAASEHFAWISSGTWSIMGVEALQPVINAQTLADNMTNEGGVGGTWRLSKNIMGLWLVQECRRSWARAGEELSYDEINHLAADARPFLAVIDPDASEFFSPGDMPARIRAYCRRTGQAVPETKGEVIRVALEGIALRYRWVLEHLEAVLGYPLGPIHIIGGGAKNSLLNQFAADSARREVISGPVEATAMGNILLQAVALGHVASIAEGREIIGRSVTPRVFRPASPDAWDEAYDQLTKGLTHYDRSTLS